MRCRRDFGRFSRGEQVSIISSIHRFFLRSSRYFPSVVISINFYHVECGDGRQLGILVDNFWIPRSKTRTFSTPGFNAELCYYFFRISTSLFLFSFQGQNNFISLMDIHVQHLASLCRICEDEIEDHKGKVDTNRFVSKIHQIWKDFLLLDSPNKIHS